MFDLHASGSLHDMYMLLQIRLFNHFQLELPSYWLRYSERIVEEMVNATFSLLSLTYANPLMLGPVHLIALLDPGCSWLKRWMVGPTVLVVRRLFCDAAYFISLARSVWAELRLRSPGEVSSRGESVTYYVQDLMHATALQAKW